MLDKVILIVDDDAEIRELLQQTFQDEGHRTAVAANGREALAHLRRSGSPDLMILDLVMPEMDGWQVLDQLRDMPQYRFPVLILSAQTPDNRLVHALDSDLRDFIPKPFDLDELGIRTAALMRRSPEPETGSHLRVHMLGTLRVFRGDTLLFDEGWRSKAAKSLFKLLYTHAGQRYPREILLEELWPDVDPDLGTNRLRVAIHELRKMLSSPDGQAREHRPIGQQEGTYFFEPSCVGWFDVSAFDDAIRSARTLARSGDEDGALEAYRVAEDLFQGDFLRDDPYVEWIVPTRERLRETHLAALGEMAAVLAAQGDPDGAAYYCRRILRMEPWREEVYRHLMEYLAAAGRANEALRAFDECRRVLQDDSAADPSPQTVALRKQILIETRASRVGAR